MVHHWIEKYFHLQQNKTTVQREVVAGMTTFLTMAYIIFVNPMVSKISINRKTKMNGKQLTLKAVFKSILTLILLPPIHLSKSGDKSSRH